MKLVKPEKKYLESYYEACQETWGHVHDDYIIHNPEKFDEWKEHIFKDYEKAERGEDLPEGFVPSETFWAVDGNEYIGTVNIRKELSKRLKEYGGHIGIVVRTKCRKSGFGEKIGKMAMAKLYDMGVDTIVLTCEESNIPSRKILEKYQPIKKEEAEVMLNGRKTPILRYYFKQ